MYLLENIGMQSSQDSSQLVVIGWVNDLNVKLDFGLRQLVLVAKTAR